MTDKLCPFCGSELEIIKFSNMETAQGDKIYEYAPCCKNDECIARNEEQEGYDYHPAGYAAPEEAAAAWNTRPIEDKLTARIAELKAEVKELKKFDWTDGSVTPEYVGWYLAHPKEVGGIRQFYYAGNPAEYEEFKDTIKEWQFQY